MPEAKFQIKRKCEVCGNTFIAKGIEIIFMGEVAKTSIQYLISELSILVYWHIFTNILVLSL